MGVPLKTAQFADIYILGAKLSNSTVHDKNLLNNSPSTLTLADQERVQDYTLFKVGIATNLRVNESLGSRSRTVIGTPIPILTPGFYDGSLSIDKATLDLHSFKSAVNINPLVAYIPSVYKGNMVKVLELNSALQDMGLQGVGGSASLVTFKMAGKTFKLSELDLPPFLFVLVIKDKILNAANTNFGAYIAMLQNFTVTLSSENAIIIESITAIARPYLATGWFQVLDKIFRTSPAFGYIYSSPHKKS